MTHTKNIHNTGVTNTSWRESDRAYSRYQPGDEILENAETLKSQTMGPRTHSGGPERVHSRYQPGTRTNPNTN